MQLYLTSLFGFTIHKKYKNIMDLAEEILGMTGMRTADGGFIR